MVRSAALNALAVAAALMLGACDESGFTSTNEAAARPAQIALDAGTSSLIQRMVDAPETALLQGVRRVEAHWKVNQVAQSMIYRERVSCDGQGRFALDPVETIEPSLGGGQLDVFNLLQKQREGFLFVHRDFMVRDLDLFFSNYQVVDLGVTTTVAGRECAQLDVQAQQDPQSVFHLAVDSETGMVLRVREEALDGALLSLVEFESFDPAPDFTGTVFHQPLTTQTALDASAKLLPFSAVRPKLLPPGYQLLSTTMLEDAPGKDVWVRYIYSDGLRELFFLYSGDADQVKPLEGSTTPPQPKADLVTVLEVGPWNVVQGEVFTGKVVVMGVAPVPVLLDTIESAFN